MTGRRRSRGLGRLARAGAIRHRAMTAVLSVTTLVSVTASVLGVGLLVAADAPFDQAFDARHGAHVRFDLDGAAVTPTQMDATATAPGVAASAGPFVTATVRAEAHDDGATHGLGLLTVVGRAGPKAPVDALSLRAGRWTTGPGEIVIDPAGLAMNVGDEFLGMTLSAAADRGTRTLTIVGIARSVTHTANAWATPATVADLAGLHPDYQMLYRFAHAGTAEELHADITAVTGVLPPGSVLATSTYLSTRQAAVANAAAFAPFVTAFGILAVIASILVIGIVTAGAVGASRQRIGVAKAIGFTPGQVARGFLLQSLLPAAVSIAIGAAAAMLLAGPVLAGMDDAYGGTHSGIPLSIVAAVAGSVTVLIALATLVPARRMARRPTVTLLRTQGSGDGPGRVRRTRRMVGRLSRRPVALGIARPARRPARSAALAATILVGTACATFAVGLAVSLSSVQHSRDPLTGAAVLIGPDFAAAAGEPGTAMDPEEVLPPDPTIGDPAAVRHVIDENPGTEASVGVATVTLSVSGLVGGTEVAGLSGDSSFTHHRMVAGHWLSGAAGEAVLPTRALHAAGKEVGDTLTLSAGGRSERVTVVGEVFDLSHDGMRVYTGVGTLRALDVDATPEEFLVRTRAGTDIDHYVASLSRELAPYGAVADRDGDGSSSVIVVMTAMTALLATMLLVVTGLGIAGTAMLEIRDRVRDLGIYKALGMTPRQIATMTLSSIGIVGLGAGLIGVPVGIVIHHAVVPAMGAVAGAVLAPSQVAVYGAPIVTASLLGGLVIALIGAIGPAVWAGRIRPAVALRTE